MHSIKNFCEHLNELIDEREGSIICSNCGLVLSPLFVGNSNASQNEKENEYVLEVLSRLNLPKYFYTEILSKIGQLSVKDKKKENVLAYVIYKTLNDMGCGVTIKEINSVTGFSDVEIYNKQPPNESVIFDPLTSAEKYCILMGLPHQSFAVIKGIISSNNTGHNPTTVIGAAIHKYCKDNQIPLNLEKIADTLKISPISIRRYLKNKIK